MGQEKQEQGVDCPEYPTTLNEIFSFIADLKFDRAVIEQQVRSDPKVFDHWKRGAYSGYPLSPYQMYLLNDFLADSCEQAGTSTQAATIWVIEVLKILKTANESERMSVVLGFWEEEDDKASPFIVRRELPPMPEGR